MKKELLKFSWPFLIFTFILYCTASFIQLDWNVVKWDTTARVLFSIIELAIFFGSIGYATED